MKLFTLFFHGILTSCISNDAVCHEAKLRNGCDYDVIDNGAYRGAMNKGVERLKKAGKTTDINKLHE